MFHNMKKQKNPKRHNFTETVINTSHSINLIFRSTKKQRKNIYFCFKIKITV